ncbi:MAG: hypothetical protein K9M07_05145 [Simkaniaceae bacterium]|nr:hypothetical protein [Simkaniaceae bacterium]
MLKTTAIKTCMDNFVYKALYVGVFLITSVFASNQKETPEAIGHLYKSMGLLDEIFNKHDISYYLSDSMTKSFFICGGLTKEDNCIQLIVPGVDVDALIELRDVLAQNHFFLNPTNSANNRYQIWYTYINDMQKLKKVRILITTVRSEISSLQRAKFGPISTNIANLNELDVLENLSLKKNSDILAEWIWPENS